MTYGGLVRWKIHGKIMGFFPPSLITGNWVTGSNHYQFFPEYLEQSMK
jgi:alpha-acetolactate decarboxylase